jgi:hypothetical protein
VHDAQRTFHKYDHDSYAVDVQMNCNLCSARGLTFSLTVRHGVVRRTVVTGFVGDDDARRDAGTQWHMIPSRWSWLERWGPIEAALNTAAASVSGRGSSGAPAMYVEEGDHDVIT